MAPGSKERGGGFYHRPLFMPEFDAGISRATADSTAIQALVAGAATDHDGAAIGTGRRILLVETGDTANAGHGRPASWGLSSNRHHFLRDRDFFIFRFLLHHTDLPLGIAV
jgi:hypothetical protein